MKFVFRVLPVVFLPITAGMPAGCLLYWGSSNLFSIGQTLLLRNPGVKRHFGIPDIPKVRGFFLVLFEKEGTGGIALRCVVLRCVRSTDPPSLMRMLACLTDEPIHPPFPPPREQKVQDDVAAQGNPFKQLLDQYEERKKTKAIADAEILHGNRRPPPPPPSSPGATAFAKHPGLRATPPPPPPPPAKK